MNDAIKKNETMVKRQTEIDVARGLAVLFMVAVHVLELFGNEEVKISTFGLVVEILGGPPAAPVFMFLLGVGIIFSKKSSPEVLAKRGLEIFFLGYVLNFFRGFIPNIVSYFLTNESAMLKNAMEQLICVDILQFAGLAFLAFALIKKFNIDKITVLIFGFGASLISIFLNSVQFDTVGAQAITGLIWGSSSLSFFPFLSWFVYPAVGYVFGEALYQSKDHKKFYRKIFLGSFTALILAALVILGLLGLNLGLENANEYYHHGIFSAILFTLFVIAWISALFFCSRLIPQVVLNTLTRWSKNVNDIYFIHWCLISIAYLVIGKSISSLFLVLVFIIALVFSDILAVLKKPLSTVVVSEAYLSLITISTPALLPSSSYSTSPKLFVSLMCTLPDKPSLIV